jgi:hypothetical protein
MKKGARKLFLYIIISVLVAGFVYALVEAYVYYTEFRARRAAEKRLKVQQGILEELKRNVQVSDSSEEEKMATLGELRAALEKGEN